MNHFIWIIDFQIDSCEWIQPYLLLVKYDIYVLTFHMFFLIDNKPQLSFKLNNTDIQVHT